MLCPPTPLKGGTFSEYKSAPVINIIEPPLGGRGQTNTTIEPPLGGRGQTNTRIILTILLLLHINFASSQSINYQELFGDDWTKAQNFEKENRSWMQTVLSKNHISYPLAIAVIFPELVRYSALRDKMEITLLKALYVNLGEDYANFSIGQFQMKPSFAEIIREEGPFALGRRSGIVFRNISEFDDIKNYRKSIVADLEDPKSEFNYLVAFIKICEKRYKTNRKNEIDRVKFLATAYNYGIEKNADQIDSMINKKFFNTSLFKTTSYCYSEVALFWYLQYQGSLK
jgi:hypothetical protein